ncbi:D-2-hydroxyacid dehydrogenase [Bacillus timonensis]|nr:D-2-hydroxyacid dehydrogenase [Bacillus timonensis]
MFVLSTVKPTKELIEDTETNFPQDTFVFRKNIEECHDDMPKAEVLITLGEDLTPSIIEKAVNLKWIMVLSAGMEKMPFEAIKNKGILVTNARGIHKIPMGEYTISMILQHARNTKKLLELEEKQEWNRRAVETFELHGKTIGILGAGAIGGEVARLAKAFNMKVLGVNRSGRKAEHVDEMYTIDKLNDVLTQVDFLISVLPSTKETQYLLEEKHFKMMKKEAVFINIGRGDLIKDSVLMNALIQGEIAHAILDVFEVEPLPKDHPFWSMDQVTVTPHISSITKNYMPRAFDIFFKNFHIYKQGSSNYVNKIDVERGY